LQLGLRFLGAAEEHAEGGLELLSPSDCTLSLWANRGLYLICRVYVGDSFVQIEHTFDGETPCETRRLCALRDQIQDDSVRVGIEILEAVREVERLPRPISATTAREHTTVGDEWPMPEGSLVCHRYLNHRMLDLVQGQVRKMQSRMVRRIEWRIEQASMLTRAFPEGQCICSTCFEAAGVEGLQLVFYPSGYNGAKEGFCSFFLRCPAGVALKCWLVVGKQRREAKLAFERSSFLGRTNFCRLDGNVEADDTALLVLEIEEARQAMTEILTHQPPNAGGSLAAEASVMTAHDSISSSPPPIESSMKLERVPGQSTLTEVRQLPSIWTPKPVDNIAEALEGFHSFYDLKARKLPSPGRRTATPRMHLASPVPSVYGEHSLSRPLASTRSDTSQKQKYHMYAE